MAVKMRIGELAKQQGLTIKAVAERAGVAYNTAHALCTDRAMRIDLDTLDRICAALRVEPGELFIRHAAVGPVSGRRDHGDSQEGDGELKPSGTAGPIEEHV